MRRLALITLSREGGLVMSRLAQGLTADDCRCYAHASVKGDGRDGWTRFERVYDFAREAWGLFDGIVFVAPAGVAVRAVAPLLAHKTSDPGVVVVDVLGRWAVSLLGGHEGGANELAMDVANVLGAEPVITTTSEAVRTVIVGVGCRKGVGAETIVGAVAAALAEAGVPLEEVRCLASASVKACEPGLREAARHLGVPLRIIPDEEIRHTPRLAEVGTSEFVQAAVGLPAVAEPAALLAGRRTRSILPRRVLNGVTVALAREDCT